MPGKPPAEPIDHHANIPRPTVSSTGGVLTFVFILTIVYDYSRDWKTIQRTFMRARPSSTRQQALAARREGARRGAHQLVAEAQGGLAPRSRPTRRSWKGLEAKLKALEPQIYLADQQYKFTKASFDAERYLYEDALANKPKSAPAVKRSLDELTRQLDERTLRLAELKREQSEAQAQIDAINARKKELETTIERRTADFRLARQKFGGLKQDTLFQLRNSPILDMINPSLRVQQVQLPDHFINVNFMRIPRVDRCTTCHIAADRKGLRTRRSRPSTGRTADAPHGRQRVDASGDVPAARPATAGRDRATSFWSAGHSPATEEQERA
jgi:hypothetical protein